MECPNDEPFFDFNANSTRAFLNTLETFAKFYQPIHGIICVFLCAFGLLTNAVHIAVLSRPSMRASAVNCLLTAVAVCDVGTMASYLVYIVHFVIRKRGDTCSPTYTHGWMQFLLWHVVLSITLHTTSLWLAVAMAFLRRMTLKVARLNSRWQRPEFAWKVTLSIYILVFIACAPNTLVHEIAPYDDVVWRPPNQKCFDEGYFPLNYTETVYTFKISKLASNNNCRFFKLNIWMLGVVFKLIPCILLFFLSIGLMLRLREAESKRRKLTNCSANGNNTKKGKTTDRTTVMLIVILAVFLITELPQGIICIMTAIYTHDMHNYIYAHLGDMLDLMSLLNSSVNFVLYCVMSSRYRKTFWTVVLPASTYKWFISRANTTSNFAMSHVSRIPSTKKRGGTTLGHEYTPLPLINNNMETPAEGVLPCSDPLLNDGSPLITRSHNQINNDISNVNLPNISVGFKRRRSNSPELSSGETSSSKCRMLEDDEYDGVSQHSN
ncbi:dmsr-7 [Pristionchus pacificus]|uniref:Dmsr-7 n=1 Tax=Pristionchus pacificus TaxID=54126 RepID=A0A2A6BGV3_PRIPA|nr:dmsr-7 [Pristionchus pacificus]|eukprot:PDM65051.1 dmsr-7 [Pristionchus pacificus]